MILVVISSNIIITALFNFFVQEAAPQHYTQDLYLRQTAIENNRMGLEFFLLVLCILFVYHVVRSFLQSRTAKKLGFKEVVQIMCFIPILNLFALVMMAGGTYLTAFVLLALLFLSAIPLVGIIFSLIIIVVELSIYSHIASKFNKNGWLAVLGVIPLFDLFFWAYLSASDVPSKDAK